MSLNPNKDSMMSNAALADMQRIVRSAAEPRAPGDSIKAAIGRAAHALGLSYRRAYDFWYASPSAAVRAHEADRLRNEELRILAAERARLTTQMQWLEMRLNEHARGSVNAEELRRPHGETVVARDEDRRAPGRLLGAEGAITDPRQPELL